MKNQTEIEDIENILPLSGKLGIEKGPLTEEKLQILLSASKTNLSETIQVETRNEPIGRVIAPLVEREIKPPERPHSLPHYDIEDFPMVAKDAETDIQIHFDITGNSTTEGKMRDINACFKDRLEKIRSSNFFACSSSCLMDALRFTPSLACKLRNSSIRRCNCITGRSNSSTTSMTSPLWAPLLSPWASFNHLKLGQLCKI